MTHLRWWEYYMSFYHRSFHLPTIHVLKPVSFPDDYGHSLGCYADVLSHFDAECSGRKSCKIHIGTLDSVAQPCPKDFKSYLEASYLCVPGMQHHMFCIKLLRETASISRDNLDWMEQIQITTRTFVSFLFSHGSLVICIYLNPIPD